MPENENRSLISSVVIGIISLMLTGYVIARAYLMSFTHDESLSFFIIRGDEYLSLTANHHILNSLLMNFCSYAFGDSEISLRLPNIFALIIYMTACFLIVRKFNNPVLTIGGFLMLNLNPFVLDFFSLARGYGLSLAFMLANLYCLIERLNPSPDPSPKRRGEFSPFPFTEGGRGVRSAAYVFGMLAVLSNFTLLNYYVAFIIADIPLLFHHEKLSFKSLGRVIENGLLIVLNMLFFRYVIPIIFRLRSGGELYYGGDGFWEGAFKTLIQDSFYFGNYGNMTVGFIAAVLVSILYLGIVLSARQWIKFRKINSLIIISLILILTLSAPVVQNLLFKTLYPKSRTALAYFPLLILVLMFSCAELIGQMKYYGRYMVLCVIIFFSLIFCFHFSKTANLRYTHSWFYDKNTKDMMTRLIKDHDRQEKISIGTNTLFWPAMNYYRIVKGADWLEPVIRNSLNIEHRYYYCYPDEVVQIPKQNITELHQYSDTKTVFLKSEK